MAQRTSPFNPDQLKKDFDISNFDVNAILRGAQLTLVGAFRALQNPGLFKYEHYKQAAIAVAIGIVMRLALQIPIILVHIVLWFISFAVDFEVATWDDAIVNGMHFLAQHVLQVPLFIMTLMGHVTPTLDNMFMESLQWVDRTYTEKHRKDDPVALREMYYHNLNLYAKGAKPKHQQQKTSKTTAVSAFLIRTAKKAGTSLVIWALSYTPLVGRFVLPAVSFYTFRTSVGLGPATLIFGTGIFLPRKYLVMFLQTYYSSRSLMRELLLPYFSRIYFDKQQKKNWFYDREGLLFGFGIGFYLLLQIPLFGVLIYGIAEASTAYLITKITDPPPPPAQAEGFAEGQQRWKNKHEFLSLDLHGIDAVEPTKEGAVASSGRSTAIPTAPPPYSKT